MAGCAVIDVVRHTADKHTRRVAVLPAHGDAVNEITGRDQVGRNRVAHPRHQRSLAPVVSPACAINACFSRAPETSGTGGE